MVLVAIVIVYIVSLMIFLALQPPLRSPVKQSQRTCHVKFA